MRALLLAIFGVPLLGIFLLVAWCSGRPAAPEKPRSEQIKDHCREEFAVEGQGRVDACMMAVMSAELQQREDDKLERAAR